jgi:hypothetical protein
MATEGHPPYVTDGNPLMVLVRIVNDPVPPPVHSGPLAAVITAMLSKDPARRPTMAQAQRLLSDVAAGQPVGQTQVFPVVREVRRAVPANPRSPTRAVPIRAGTTMQRPSAPSQAALPWPGSTARPAHHRGALVVAIAAMLMVATAYWLVLSNAPKGTGRAAGHASTVSSPNTPTGTGSTQEKDPTLSAELMTSFVHGYYGRLPADTAGAWNLLGPGLRAQGFASYQAFWSTIASVTTGDLDADPVAKTVTGTVIFTKTDGTVSTEQHRFDLISDPGAATLRIDSDTLLSAV